MSSNEEEYDTRFSLPAIDDPPSTETGVILMGLSADRLVAGLGLATLADDPARVTLLVDQARHGALDGITVDALIAAGADRWQSARPALEAAPAVKVTGALRKTWTRALGTLDQTELGEIGPASRSYLAACWLRRAEVDRVVEEARAVPEVAP